MRNVLVGVVAMTVAIIALPMWQHDSFGEPDQPAANRSPRGPRQVQRFPDKPIASQLKPTDKEIELLDFGTSPGLTVVDESGKLLEPMARSHDLVAVIKVTDIASDVTSDQTWVTSTVTGEIVDLWKSPPETKGHFVAGGRLEFPWEGGTVVVDGRMIRARVSWVRPLQEGATYLVFGWFPEGELRIPLQSTYEVVDSKLRPVSTGSGGRDDIERDTLENVKSRVTAAIARAEVATSSL